MKNILRLLLTGFLALAIMDSVDSGWAKYKARTWNAGPRKSYSASLTSEGVTIAVEPLFTDALAAQVFDKNDMITRGIMPMAVLIFNDNDFPIEVDGMSIELIHKDQHIRTMPPNEVVYRLFRKDKTWTNQPMPKLSRTDLNQDALEDFDNKFLMKKTVTSHSNEAGFLFFHLPDSEVSADYLSQSLVYIPKIYRRDNGSRLIYFEIDIAPAIKATSPGTQ
jgi:hypothetical protein